MAASPRLAATFYPHAAHLQDVAAAICSEHGGIAQSLLVSPLTRGAFDIRSISAQMPGYHKVLLGPDVDLQYHLGGYGTFHEEALIRLVGEAVERYSLLVAPCTMRERIFYATYDEVERRGRVVPFEYLRLFSDADYARLNGGRHRGLRRLERSDVVGWLACASLFDADTEIHVPAQMLFVGYKRNQASGEVLFSPAFSTGTAAHTSVEQALASALLEFVEIDALMLRWYAGMAAPRVTIDNLDLAALTPRLLAADAPYELFALDLSVLPAVDAHVLASVLVHKREESPFILLGAQGHLNPVKAFYRSLMEAAAISFLAVYGPLFLPREYLSKKGSGFTDLDTNVAFFASPDDASRKRSAIEALVSGKRALSTMKDHGSGDARKDVARLVQQLSAHSEYGVYLDVTPPETRSQGWKVMRVFLPELVTMCVPGVPYTEHPRIKAHGGVRNDLPHPLP